MLLAGLIAGIHFEEPLGCSFGHEADFLLQFAHRTRVVIFAAAKMAR